ncbi:hypothetical protein J6V86_03960 [bacterium]|nr:hypothetical protein [bacterium]
MKTKNTTTNKFLAQNIESDVDTLDEVLDSVVIDSVTEQNEVDNIYMLNSRNDQTFQQCSAAGDVYSDEELNENLQEIVG